MFVAVNIMTLYACTSLNAIRLLLFDRYVKKTAQHAKEKREKKERREIYVRRASLAHLRHDLPLANSQRTATKTKNDNVSKNVNNNNNNNSPRLGRGVRQLKHGGHVYQSLADFAVRAAHKTQRNRELEQKPVDEDQVADRRLPGRFVFLETVSSHGQRKQNDGLFVRGGVARAREERR